MGKTRLLRLLMVSFMALVSLPCAAQLFKLSADKTVSIQISHPPSLGLTVKRIAFGQPSGTCAPELVDTVIKPEFSKNQVEVIDRQNLDQILAEHNFSQTIYADPQSTARLGRILGPSALIIVKVYDCSTEKQPLVDNSQRNLNGTLHTFFISKTTASLKGSIELVDLTTGRSLGSREFESHPEQQNTSDAGQPEFPPDYQVKTTAMQEAGDQITHVFFPWVESASYVFYDDKDCGLKDAYELLHRGDRDGALKLSESNLQQCESAHKKDKTLARAAYNVGIGYFLRGDYDKASQFLHQAMQSKGADNTAGRAAADCDRARQLGVQLKTYLDRIAQIPAPSAIAAEGPAPPPAPVVATVTEPPKPAAITPPPAPAAEGASKPSVEDRLKRLDELLKKGYINRQDYEKKKAEILKEL